LKDQDVFQMTQKMMLKRLLIALLIVAAILVIPVAASYSVTLTCPSQTCVNQEYECTFHAEYSDPVNEFQASIYYYVEDSNQGENGEMTYASGIGLIDENTRFGDAASWIYLSQVPIPWQKDETVKYLPKVTGTYENSAAFNIYIPATNTGLHDYQQIYTEVTTCTNTPEFPSAFLPVTMIIGFLGAVLLIQRTKEK
jgi:hypothetical protein